MKKTLKLGSKMLAVLLAVVTVIGVLPMTVFAEEYNEHTESAAGQTAAETVTDDKTENDTGSALDSVIAGEVVSKRGETTKQFKNTDGSFLSVDYGYPVHYKESADGEWKDVDYSLVGTGKKSADGPAELSAKAAPYGI